MAGFRLTLLLLGGYVGLIAMAALAGPQMAEFRALLVALLPYQASAVLLAILAMSAQGGAAQNGFGQVRWRGMVWLLPGWVVLAAMFWNIANQVSVDGGPEFQRLDLLLLLGVPLLIALGEEVMFRGVLLRQAMAWMPATRAMLLSAVLFGLFHLVNGLLGHGFANALEQVAFAFLVGLFLAPIALRLDNLWPLIIWHWLWNVAVFTSQAADVLQPLVLLGIAMQVVISGWLWRDMAEQEARG